MDELEALLARDYVIQARSSWWRARISFGHLRRAFPGGFPIEDSYAASSRYVLDRQREGAALATVRNELAALGSALRAAAQTHRIAARPPLALPIIGDRNARTGFFRDAQLDELVRHLPGPLRPLVRSTYITGFRRGEALGLTWDQVDRERGAVRLEARSTKNHEARVWPFQRHPELRRILEEQYEARASPFVFHRRGEPILDFRRAWKTACRDAGLGGRLFHDLRRSAARNMVLAGVPTRLVLKLLGWKTEAMLRRYGIFDELDLAQGVRHYARYGNGRHEEEATQALHDHL